MVSGWDRNPPEQPKGPPSVIGVVVFAAFVALAVLIVFGPFLF